METGPCFPRESRPLEESSPLGAEITYLGKESLENIFVGANYWFKLSSRIE